MRTSIEVETAHFNSDRILEASYDLVTDVAKRVDLENADVHIDGLTVVKRTIVDQLNRRPMWNTPRIGFAFSGFTPPNFRIEDGRPVFSQRSPYFVLEEGTSYHLLNPDERTWLDEEIASILQRTSRTHNLEVSYEDPVTVVTFPKEEYAEKIEWNEVPLLGNR